MPNMKKAAVVRPARIVCGNASHALRLKINAPKSFSTSRPVSTLAGSYPTGCCMKELAIRIHSAERFEPIATSQMEARCSLLGDAVPAKDPDAQEGGLQEEGEQGLDRQRCTEDITDVARVLGPVHAELEFLDDAGHHAHGES